MNRADIWSFMFKAPPSVRSLFRDPCTRVAGEVAKVLQELAVSIRSHWRCAPDVLSDHHHEALQDLNSAIRSQPRLFLGTKHACAANKRMLMEKNTAAALRATLLPSSKTDTISPLERKSTGTDPPAAAERNEERATLRPTLSKIAVTNLEFSEALPFAAFASLLVEMVVRLELVIEEVKNLERAANFREYAGHDHLVIDVPSKEKMRNSTNGKPQLNPVSPAAE
jgi:hypothetical protein